MTNGNKAIKNKCKSCERYATDELGDLNCYGGYNIPPIGLECFRRIDITDKTAEVAEISHRKKYDDGKLRMDLIQPETLISLAKIYTMGAEKYGANNWQGFAEEPERIKGALLRHYVEYMSNPRAVDAESGLLHIEHVVWNAVTLAYFAVKDGKP